MPTERQKKLARAIVKNAVAKDSKTQGQILESVGYSKNTAKAYPGEVIAAEGVQVVLRELGYLEKFKAAIPDEMLIRVTREGLGASKVISAYGATDSKNDFIEVPDHQTRHKFLETAHKLRGDFAPEKHITINAELKANLSQEKIDEINRLALDD